MAVSTTPAGLVRSAGFAVLFLVALVAGRLTVIGQDAISLVFPAAGVAALWFTVQRSAGTRWLDYPALAAISFAVNIDTGTSSALAGSVTTAMVVQVTLFSRLLRRWHPQLWDDGGPQPLASVRGLLGAALLSSVGGVLTGLVVLGLTSGQWSWLTASVWLTRNTVSILLITAVGGRVHHVLGSRHSPADRGGVPPAASLPFLRPSGWGLLELVALVACSAAAYLLTFVLLDGLPLAFPLLSLTVWAALRFDTTIVVLHNLALGAAAVLFTLHGSGPFAAIVDDAVRVLVVQAFTGMVAVVGLTLALGRDERALLMCQLRRQAADADAHAQQVGILADASRELFTAPDPREAICRAACLIAGADGAYLLEPDGRGDLVSTAVAGAQLPSVCISLSTETALSVATFRGDGPVFVPDIRGHPGVSQRLRQSLDVASGTWQPVLAHGAEPVGVLVVLWNDPVHVLPGTVSAMLATLAAEAASAVERGDLLARLAQAADRDPLTGLANRRRWDENVAGEVARAERSRAPLTFVLVDLDHFKRYNDTFGHLAGDALLREFAVAAGECLRTVDTLARWGGEEFVAALPGCTADEALQVADRIRASVPRGQTCTVGLAQWAPGDTPDAVLARADAALYRGKETGRDVAVIAGAGVAPAVLR